MSYKKVTFSNGRGDMLGGRIEFPLMSKPDAYAVFAHAFTGSHNLIASKYICRSLMLSGIAVLRFDFTGLGVSEGDFSETTFSTNIEDIKAACRFLEEEYEAPRILVGHSLGGAAALFAASEVDSVLAVATVGTPSEPEHVTHLLQAKMDDIIAHGSAKVKIGTKELTIKKKFIDDIQEKLMAPRISHLNKALLILHSPQDRIVEIENAAKIYQSARHPKSFITLNKANHMLMDKEDAFYVGEVIASWAQRYIEIPEKEVLKSHRSIVSHVTTDNRSIEIVAGKHGFLADTSESLGGNDLGPSPYELLSAALSASTAKTVFNYAKSLGYPIEEVKVHISYDSRYEDDFKVDMDDIRGLKNIIREVEIIGDLSQEERDELIEIASHCPIYKTLSMENDIKTVLYKK